MAEEPPGTGLVPPSHFMLRPSRTLGAELAAERRRGQALEAELVAERRRGQALEAELAAERRRGQALEAELAAERRRGQALEAELAAERRRGQALEAELAAERRRGQALEAELAAERRRGQALEAELAAERRRGQALGAELESLRGRGQAEGAGAGAGQPLEQVLLRAQLSALSHILTLQEQELDLEVGPGGAPDPPRPPRPQVSPPGPCPPRPGALLGRWRHKVFVLLVQLQVQEEALRSLRGQVRALGTAVAAGTQRVTRLELQLHEGEKLRGDTQAGRGGDGAGSPGDKSHQELGDNERPPEPGRTEAEGPESAVTQVTKAGAGDRRRVAALVTQLQALGAAILGDTGDTP